MASSLEKEAETTQDILRTRLAQHHVDLDLLAVDDFDGFFVARQAALLTLIGAAMGKEVATGQVPSLPDEYDLDEEELLAEDISEMDAELGG